MDLHIVQENKGGGDGDGGDGSHYSCDTMHCTPYLYYTHELLARNTCFLIMIT